MLALRSEAKLALLSLLAILAAVRTAGAQGSWTQRGVIAPADAGRYTSFARDADRMLATVHYYERVDVLSRSSGSWVVTSAIEPVETTNTAFGGELALDGNTAVIGDPAGFGDVQGSAYVFARNASDQWSFLQKLLPPDPTPGGDRFGSHMALEGDTLIIGAPNKNFDSLTGAGRAYAFERAAGTWQFRQIIADPAPDSQNSFGSKLALQGDTLLIGVSNRDVDGVSRQGAVYVYSRAAGAWSLAQRIVAPDADPGAGFGQGVTLDGETALISSWMAGGPYVFRRSNAGWNFVEKLVPSTTAQGTGEEVGIEGNTVFLGASTGGGVRQGLVFVFDRTGGAFTEQQLISGPTELLETSFGMRIGLSGNNALILNSNRLFEYVRPGSAGASGTGPGPADAGPLDAGSGGSSSGAGGALGTGGGTNPTPGAPGASEDGGCGCRVPGGGSHSAWLLVLGFLVYLRRAASSHRLRR